MCTWRQREGKALDISCDEEEEEEAQEGGVVVVTDMTDGDGDGGGGRRREEMTREISFPEQERESDARRREGSGQRKKWEKWRKKPTPPVDHLTALPETSTPRPALSLVAVSWSVTVQTLQIQIPCRNRPLPFNPRQNILLSLTLVGFTSPKEACHLVSMSGGRGKMGKKQPEC